MSLLTHPVREPGLLESVLSVSPFEEDQNDLRAILSDWPAPLQSVRTMEDTIRCLDRVPTALILCERDLPDGNWKLLFDHTATLARPPRIIVSSRLADDYLWVEVLNWGGQDVLQTPFVAREVRLAVQSAWDAWQRMWAPATVRRPSGRVASAAAAACAAGSTEPWPQLAAGKWPDAVERPSGWKRAN